MMFSLWYPGLDELQSLKGKRAFSISVLKVGGTLLTALLTTQGVRFTSSGQIPRARDPGLRRPPSHALSLNSSSQPVCQRIHAQPRDAMEK